MNLKPVSILLAFIFFTSCNNEEKLSEYKYADKKFDVTCTQVNPDLLKEAVYSFEEDITTSFAKNGQKNLSQAYSRVISTGIYGMDNYEQIASDHTKEIFKLLKKEPNLWNTKGDKTTLNYNHELIKCLAENMSNKDLKTTLNALLSTNSMSVKLFGEPLRRQSRLAMTDKYLGTYIALDFYYANLFNADLDATKTDNIKQKPKNVKTGGPVTNQLKNQPPEKK